MIEKITEDAYLVVDINSFTTTIQMYDPLTSNQTVCGAKVEESEEEIGLD